MTTEEFQKEIRMGIPDTLPEKPVYDTTVNHAPKRKDILTQEQKKLALRNALRYFPEHLHSQLAPEFADELHRYGRIYMYRYRPQYEMYARPIDEYPARSRQAAAIMLMIQNNLDPRVAQHPHELIIYGGNGAIFQNWAQYRLVMRYLSEMTDEQTLVMYSGHPLGLFPSHRNAPRVVVTNGMVIPNYSKPDDWERLNALGVSQYGQMTAGSYMYIGPQGIVHGTTITVLNAARKQGGGTAGKLFVTAGLGGMSGAQPKAGNIAGVVSITAEINPAATQKRYEQGWVDEVYDDIEELFGHVNDSIAKKEARSYAYQGNVVDLWEYAAEHDIHVDLGSDQTSLHNPWAGGYYPVGLSLEESKAMMADNPELFKEKVQASLRRHVAAINKLTARGMYFFDYGNAFLLQAGRAGADVFEPDAAAPQQADKPQQAERRFRYPSYVQDIMGPMCFDYGFGPFRWVCASGKPADLANLSRGELLVTELTLKSATTRTFSFALPTTFSAFVSPASVMTAVPCWSSWKIGMSHAEGRLSGPVVLGRDHHDVSGTDSPYRETSNIYDGSQFCADMAVQNVIGDAFRGATWVSIHNGGGVGWGEVINGGFGMVIDGSEESERHIREMLFWDVNNGIARRSWARNSGSMDAIRREMERTPELKVTLPNLVDDEIIENLLP